MAEIRSVTRDGVRIVYEVRDGDGPWLVLVHGLGYDRRDWEVVADGLAGRCRLVLIDNRGVGDSDVPPTPWTVEDMADDVAAVLADLGLTDVCVLGASLGGAIVQSLAHRHPQRVGRVVLCCPLVSERATFPEATIPPGTDHNLVDGRHALRTLDIDPELPRRNVAWALAPATVETRPELVDRILELRLAKPVTPAGWLAQDLAGASWRYCADIPDLTQPVLLLHGTEDRVVAPRASELLAARWPDARLVLLEGAGHLMWWEQPERFVAEVTAFAAGEVGP